MQNVRTWPQKGLTIALASAVAMMGLLFFSPKVDADSSPGGCDASGFNFSFDVFQDAGGTIPATGVGAGQTVYYRVTLSHAGGTNCDFGGVAGDDLTLTLPGGVAAPGSPFVVPLVTSGSPFSTGLISYVVQVSDVGIGGAPAGHIRASALFDATSHRSPHQSIFGGGNLDTPFVDVRISISPSQDANEAGTNHVLTITLEKKVGAGAFTPLNGETVSASRINSLGATAEFVGSNTCITAGLGQCTVTINSPTAGSTEVNATWAGGTVDGATISSRTTNGVAPNSGPADKDWVKVRISITPATDANEAGTNHILTITLEQSVEEGVWTSLNGETVSASLINSLGATAAFVGSNSCLTAGSGQCTVTINSPTAGNTAVEGAWAGGTVAGATISSKATNPDASKNWVKVRISITPAEDTNPVGSNHILTITLEQSVEEGVWTSLNGETVSASLINSNGATAVFVGSNTCITAGAGQCTVTISSPTAGTTVVEATWAGGTVADASVSSKTTQPDASKLWVAGTIIVIKDTVPNDTTDFAFTTNTLPGGAFSLEDDGDTGDELSNTKTYSGLAPGAYDVAETSNPAYSTLSSCDSSDQADTSTPGAIDLNAGETITCTFTNTLNTGKIELLKDFVGTPESVTLKIGTTEGASDVDSAVLATDGTTGENTVAPNAYFVSETLTTPANYASVLACYNDVNDNDAIDGGDTVHSVNTGTGSVLVGTNEDVLCRFTNTLQTGHIIVNKVTVGGDASFNFTTNGTGYNGFSLSNGQSNNQEVQAGAYTVAESALAGWDSDGGVCDNDEAPNSVDVGPGETITCTFTNTKRGSISGMKFNDLNGNGVKDQGEPGLPGWTINLSGNGSVVTDVNGNYTFTNLAPGQYTVSETQQAGWTQTFPAVPGTHAVDLAAGEDETGKDFGNTRPLQGCTPGYWKQSQHFDSWVVYATGNDFDTVFGRNAFTPNKTLLQVLSQGGGGLKALARHAVAALLNSANPDVDYAYDSATVISMFQAAFDSGDYETAKNLFETNNELGCPLN